MLHNTKRNKTNWIGNFGFLEVKNDEKSPIISDLVADF